MFYKLLNNEIVVDVLDTLQYVRYLAKSKRWVLTDAQSAHGVRGSDQNTIYFLEGRNCPCESEKVFVRVEEIDEAEYLRFTNEIALRAKENAELRKEIDLLREQL